MIPGCRDTDPAVRWACSSTRRTVRGGHLRRAAGEQGPAGQRAAGSGVGGGEGIRHGVEVDLAEVPVAQAGQGEQLGLPVQVQRDPGRDRQADRDRRRQGAGEAGARDQRRGVTAVIPGDPPGGLLHRVDLRRLRLRDRGGRRHARGLARSGPAAAIEAMLADRVRAAVSALPGSVSASSASRSSHSGGTPPWSTPRCEQVLAANAPAWAARQQGRRQPGHGVPRQPADQVAGFRVHGVGAVLERPARALQQEHRVGRHEVPGQGTVGRRRCSAAAALAGRGPAPQGSLIPFSWVSIVPSQRR